MQYPPDDPSAARAAAAAALLSAIRDVRDTGDRFNIANERLQLAAAFVLEAFGDTADAETVRMLLPGGSRPGKPAVPPPVRLKGGIYVPGDVADALDAFDPDLRDTPDSVTGDEILDRAFTASVACERILRLDDASTRSCGHQRDVHDGDNGECAYCSCIGFLS